MSSVSSLSSSGSEFQMIGPATENVRRPSVEQNLPVKMCL